MRLTCKRRLKGRHDLKVLLLRNVWKKAGQAELVKLFPRLVSKGLGRGELGMVVDTVISEAVDEEAVPTLLVGATMVDGRDVVDEGKDINVDDVDMDETDESPACRRYRSKRGAGRRSMRISPFLANRASVDLWDALSRPVPAIAVVHNTDRKRTIDQRVVRGLV